MYTTIRTIALRNNNYNFQTNNPLEKMDLELHYDYTSYQVVEAQRTRCIKIKARNTIV